MARILEFYARRPQLQERLTAQVADHLVRLLAPRGVVVVIEARHLCMEMRGVRSPGSIITTSALRGAFESREATRMELYTLIKGERQVL